jgi:hypothetical protein
MKSTSPVPFVIALLIAGAGIYWYFFTGTEQPPLMVNEPASQAQTKFQTLLSELTPISFNTSIFSDPRFNALVDLTTPISPETIGRLDPFAPIAGISGN